MKQKAATMNISLSPVLREHVEKKTTTQGYSSTSEYVRELIRKDAHRAAAEQVDALLLEGLRSGPATPMTATDWRELRHRANRKSTPHEKTPPASRRAARSR